MSHLIGSIELGKLADLVLWKPARFGTKPELVLKSGFIAWANMGDPNASIPSVQPVYGRAMFGSLRPESSVAWVSGLSIEEGVVGTYGLRKRVEAVKGCRNIGKADMRLNESRPKMKVDPESYRVEADGVVCEAPAMEVLPLTQGSFVY